MNSIIIGLRYILRHKWKILTTFILSFVFLFLLFPFQDLNDFISQKVLQLTQNKVYLQFEDLSINPLTTTLHFKDVQLDTGSIDQLQMSELNATPSIIGLLQKKPAGKVEAKGLLGGNLEISLHPTTSENKEIEKSEIQIYADSISLKQIRQMAQMDLPLQGKLQLQSKLKMDLAFIEQPEGDISATITQFELSSGSVNLSDLGKFVLPEIKLAKVEVKGRLQGGKFIIESGTLGAPKDEFYGTVRGELGLQIQNMGGQIRPIVNTYDLSIDFLAKPSFISKTQFFLSILDKYKKDEAPNSRYKFKLVSSAPGMPPQFSPLN